MCSRRDADLGHADYLGSWLVAALLLGLSGSLLVEDLYGGWEELSGEPSTLILWKTTLFIGVLVLAVVHGIVLGPGIRRLRLRRAEERPIIGIRVSAKDRVRRRTAEDIDRQDPSSRVTPAGVRAPLTQVGRRRRSGSPGRWQ